MKRQVPDYPLDKMRVVYTCDRCGRVRDRADLLEYHEFEMYHEGLGHLRDDRLGLYFVCKGGCNGLDKV